MNLSKCHCGGEAVVGPGTNRIKQRGAAEVELARLRAMPTAASKRLQLLAVSKKLETAKASEVEEVQTTLLRIAAVPSASVKELQLAENKLKFLQAECFECHCDKCGAWCWGRTEKDAGNLWNRAIQKLAVLKDCCKASGDVRVDHDGMVLVRCNECNLRHLPLGTRD